VVEDDKDISFLIRRILHKIVPHGHIRHAFNGSAAKDELLRDPHPTILITDLDMPILNGFGLIEWARTIPDLAFVRIVVFSGSDEPNARQRCQKLKIDDFICKTANMEKLTARIRSLLAEKSIGPAKIEGPE
jgi:DNA-binding response OmpR family regulator